MVVRLRSFILIIFILSLIGCKVAIPTYDSPVDEIDLRPYSEAGFFVTTGDYFKDYEPVSILVRSCKSKVTVEDTRQDKSDDDIYRKQELKQIKYCNLADMVGDLVKEAKSRGANGLIQVKIESKVVSEQGQYIPYVFISGMAIKR